MRRNFDVRSRAVFVRLVGLCTALLCLGVAPHTSAAVVSGVTVSQVSSELDPTRSPYPWDERAIYLIDGSGLDGAGLHGNNSFGTMWAANTFVPTQTNGPTDTAPFIVFDLGAAYALESIKVWNYNGVDSFHNYSGRSVRDVDISVSDLGIAYSDVGSYVLAPAPGINGYAGQSLPFAHSARFVRFDIRSNHAGSLDFGVGLSEIRFTAVPSPPAGILLGSALIGLPAWARRRGIKGTGNKGDIPH